LLPLRAVQRQFDTTSTYFEGADPEWLASFGFSRDKRGDRPQANLALLTSREGLPLGHWLYPGKQSDVKSMAEASREFRDRLAFGSFVVVADRGVFPFSRTVSEVGVRLQPPIEHTGVRTHSG
jgi:transposase